MVSGLWAMVAAVNRSHQRVMCRFPMSHAEVRFLYEA